MSKLFFRNDDVCDQLDDSLITLTELFVELQIPIIHAVEPANVSEKVVEWLMTKKMKYPALIEAGSSNIFGHHLHNIQGIEYHNGVPIFYSLGNFFFPVFEYA